MNFVIMIKLTKASEDTLENMQANDNKFDHRLFSQTQEYRLEASIDILKLYDTLNDLELEGCTGAAGAGAAGGCVGHPSGSCGYAGGAADCHSPTIIFPDDHPPPSGLMPTTDGGSVSSYLSPLSNSHITAFATNGGGSGGDGREDNSAGV